MNVNQNKSKESRNHHFLPVFFLNGFTNEEGTFTVYDKVLRKFHRNHPPKNYFYVKDLNTLKHDGQRVLNYEDRSFCQMDKEAALLFKKICDPSFTNEEQLTPLERFQIISFLQSLYWRSPKRDQLLRELIKKEGLFNKYFGVNAGGQELPLEVKNEITKRVLNNPEETKAFKHIIPLTSGTEELWNLVHKWQLTPITAEGINFIIGDDPFLINNPNVSFTNVFDELVIPISKKHLLKLSCQSPRFLDSMHFFQINLSTFIQAKRFVASHNEEYLREMLEHYNLAERNGWLNKFPKIMFNIMHRQSKFETYEDYMKEYGKELFV